MSVYFFRKRGVCGGGTFCAWLFAGMLLTAVWGCSRHEPVARIERQERGMALYREAIAEEQAGNLDGAIRLLKQLLASEPQIFSAHFQLATLLQDYAKDYVGAIHHYIAYLELRPDAEKASVPLPSGTTLGKDAGKSVTEMRTLIQERIRRAKELLAPQLLTELGDSVEGVSQAHLMRENERLNGQVKTLTVEKSALTREKEDALTKVKSLQDEADRLRRLITRMRGDMEAETAPAPRKTVKAETPEKPAESPAARRSALQQLREEAESLGAAVPKPDEPKKAEPVATSKPRALPKPEAAPKTPVVKESDLSAVKREALAEIEKTEKPADPKPAPEEEKGVEAPADARDTLNALLGRGPKRETKSSPESMRVYVVQPGDTLFRVSERFYGDTTKWKKIRDANRTRIDPDGRIRAGQSILIP
ncbi:MAG: LysM peptidoglycan-binding domain-containing protein [Kiritimatiellae bacterium]|nr:LysM peptidoglycan-binding domain-containing protein [Kiritimatiellia bacterium]